MRLRRKHILLLTVPFHTPVPLFVVAFVSVGVTAAGIMLRIIVAATVDSTISSRTGRLRALLGEVYISGCTRISRLMADNYPNEPRGPGDGPPRDPWLGRLLKS